MTDLSPFKASCRCCLFSLIGLGIGIFFGGPDSAYAGDPLMDREGRTLTVTVNGTKTSSIPEKEIKDSNDFPAYEVFWTGSAKKGQLCFKLETHDSRLGAPEKIDILVHEIRKDREHQKWKNYNLVPSPAEALGDFSSANGYCPKEYTLTDRLRYPELPPGQYVFRIAYWGVGNWDRQDILFTITE